MPTPNGDQFVADQTKIAGDRGWNTEVDIAPCGCITVGMYEGDDLEAEGAIKSISILLCADEAEVG